MEEETGRLNLFCSGISFILGVFYFRCIFILTAAYIIFPFPIFIFADIYFVSFILTSAKMEEGMGAGQYYFSASKQTPK